MKIKLSIFPILIAVAFLLFFPQIAFTYSKVGLLLWFYTLLPSLLPFMILSNFILHSNLLKKLISRPAGFWHFAFGLTPEGAYALILGLFCGYPMGAKVTADLYRTGRISKQEASYLLTFANCASPMFLSSFVVTETLHRPDLIGKSFVILYLSNYLCSLLFRHRYTGFGETAKAENKKEIPSISHFGEMIDISIMNAFESITKLGGYIILFSICSGLIQELLPSHNPLKYLLLGVTEITTGISTIGSLTWSFSIKYSILMGLTGFGGICILAQTKSMLHDTTLSIKPYLLSKCCNLAFTMLLSIFLI